MVKIRKEILSVLSFFFLSFNPLFSQGTINAPAKECLNNVTSFTYTPPSGLTLSSANWNFGDGFTSSSLTPVHTYGSTGKYTIIIEATFTNSTTAKDSIKLEVFGLPMAAFHYELKNDTCLTRNMICFLDSSKPALPGQTITSRLFVWGDGSTATQGMPVPGQKLCHKYQIPDVYTLRMEMTDIHGCKNSVSRIVNIAENIDPAFAHKKFYDGLKLRNKQMEFINCNTVELCLKNESDPYNKNTDHYEWHIDNHPVDTTPFLQSFKCVRFTKTQTINAMLIAYANNNCRDTFRRQFEVVIDSLPTYLDLMDTVRCFGDESLNESWFKRVAWDTFYWYFDGGLDPLKKSPYAFFGTRLFPGIHEVKAEIVRGSCITTLKRNYKVLGPFALMRIIDREQCFSNRQVYFVDNSKGIDRNNCKFFWNIRDSLGDVCTSYREKDINKFLNCNYSQDWYTKHMFSKVKKLYNVSFWVKDTVTGCEDSTLDLVNMKYCSVLLNFDSVKVCQDKTFLEDIPPPYPIEYTIDSAKQIWKQFPTLIDSTFKGNYDVGLRFKTVVSPWSENIGDDSIKIHSDSITFYDTVYMKDYLHVKDKKTDSIYATIHGNCKPFRISLHFRDGKFKKGERLEVIWGVGGSAKNYDSTFTSPQQIDSLVQIVSASGFQTEIMIKMENEFGCTTLIKVPVERGLFLSKYHVTFSCLYSPVCFIPYVFEMNGKGFWPGNSPNRKVSWWFDDTAGIVERFTPCYKFKKGGYRQFKMLTVDTFGCHDTLSDQVFIQDVKADVKYSSRFAYCSELKQFFDSSSILTHPDDSIIKYLWQFGSGVFSSIQKDPVQSLNTALDKIPASHMIITSQGCYDTMFFEIDVIGPKPYFTIRDTIGCGSLNAEFTNLSKNCKQYIWQYGDSAQTTYQTFSKQPVSFLYKKPGRYHISLVGIDTVFNPITNSMQSCISIFPDKVFQKDTTRTVMVLPYNTTGIVSKDTICLGTPITFLSKSDTAYDFDYWQMGDTSAPFKLNAGSSHTYSYKATGLYNVKLNPFYNLAFGNQCRDSATKTILVLGVLADFDIDPGSKAPVFQFHDKSVPSSAILKWDFGHPGSGPSNSSTAKDPSHNYDKDTGTFNVCLIASLAEGCPDTICKTVFNDFKEGFGIYNVFSPGLLDGKNDQYDIEIENEELYDLQIYNRWGQLVYQGDKDADNSENINWNGKIFNNGPECPGGTYYYLFRYSLKQKPEEVMTLSGVITLIR